MRADARARTDLLRSERALPNFLIIGAMRAGTTALWAYLKAHPDVFMPGRKEIHFFDSYFHKGIGWYSRWFDGAGSRAATGESTPSYMYHDVAIERMAQVVPDARLIAILRNPADRAYAHYWLNRAMKREKLGFAEAIAAEPVRLASARRKYLNRTYLDRGRYLSQLLRVCERYPRDRLYVVIFEELRDRPAEIYGEVCRFLGVDGSFTPPNLGDRVAGYKTHRSALLNRTAKRLPRSIRGRVRRFNSSDSRYPPVDPAVRSYILQRFEADNQALAAWLGRDLSVWKT